MKKNTSFTPSPVQQYLYYCKNVDDVKNIVNSISFTISCVDQDILEQACYELVKRYEILRTIPVIYSEDNQPYVGQKILPIEDSYLLSKKLLSLKSQPEKDDEITIFIEISSFCSDFYMLVDFVNLLSIEYKHLVNKSEKDLLKNNDIYQYADFSYAWSELLEDSNGRDYWEEKKKHYSLASNTFNNFTKVTSNYSKETITLCLSKKIKHHFIEKNKEIILFSIWILLVSKLTNNSQLVIDYYSADIKNFSEDDIFGPIGIRIPVYINIDLSLTIQSQLQSIYDQASECIENMIFFNPVNDHCSDSYRIVYHSNHYVPVDFAGKKIKKFTINCEKQFTDILSCTSDTEKYTLNVDFYGDIYRDKIEEIKNNLELWIYSIQNSPERMLDSLTWENISTEKRNTEDIYSVETLDVINRILATAQENPEAIAIQDFQMTLNYRELASEFLQLAVTMRETGVASKDIVAISLPRDRRWISCWLAVWYLGAIPLPLANTLTTRDIQCLEESKAPYLLLDQDRSKEEVRYIKETTTSLSEVILIPSEYNSIIFDIRKFGKQHPIKETDTAYLLFTSGSSGTPKGVPIHFAALHHYLSWASTKYEAKKGTGTLIHTDWSYDLLQTSMWLPLINGNYVELMPPESDLSSLYHKLCKNDHLSFIKLTPSHLQAFSKLESVEEGTISWPPHVVVGGAELTVDMLPPSLIEANTSIHNEYGPTETTVGCSVFTFSSKDYLNDYYTDDIDKTDTRLAIGNPISGINFFVLDNQLNLVPPGVIGELYIAGIQNSHGYFYRPSLSAEKFLPCPFIDHKKSQFKSMYATGDLVKYSGKKEGYTYIGRVDNQIKRLGYRIEPAELTHQIIKIDRVSSAYTLVINDNLDIKLITFIVSAINISEIRNKLKNKLPEHFIPNEIIKIENIPVTDNGKVDEKKLRDLYSTTHIENIINKLDPTEKILVSIWQSILNKNFININDDFFSQGGDSIRLIQAAVAGKDQGLPLTAEIIFKYRSIKKIALHLKDKKDKNIISKNLNNFYLITPEDRNKLPKKIESAFPISQLQMIMLYHNEKNRKTACYHDIFSYKLKIFFNREKIEIAIKNVIARHPMLRTGFELSTYSQPIQMVWQKKHLQTNYFLFEDISHLSNDEQKKLIKKWITKERDKGFLLNSPPLIRFKIHLLDKNIIQFTTSFHHAIMDGWSDQQIHTEIFDEYSALLKNKKYHLSTSKLSFLSFIDNELSAIESTENKEFWKSYLNGYLPIKTGDLDLSYESGVENESLEIKQSVTNKLISIAEKNNVTLKTLLLAAHFKTLSIIRGEDDLLSCVVSNCRPETADSSRAVGLFINSIPTRVKLSCRNWKEFIFQVMQQEHTIYPHRFLPLAEIQKISNNQFLCDVLFYYTNFHNGIKPCLDLVQLDKFSHEITSFPLVISVNLDPNFNSLSLQITYQSQFYSTAFIRRFINIYHSALKSLVFDIEIDFSHFQYDSVLPLSILTNSSLPKPSNTIIEAFEEQAIKINKTAIISTDGELSYKKLNCRANQLASLIIKHNITPETPIGILVKRNSHAIVAQLSVLKASSCFIMLDLFEPLSTLEEKAKNCKFIITQFEIYNDLPVNNFSRNKFIFMDEKIIANEPTYNLSLSVNDSQLAYQMFTSGSTGKPKCVMVEHKNFTNILFDLKEKIENIEKCLFVACTNITFDIHLLEFFLPIISGASVEIVEREIVQDGVRLKNHIDTLARQNQYLVIQGTPSLWELLRTAGWQGQQNITVLSGGEKLPKNQSEWLLACCANLWDLYGPTETTIWSTTKKLDHTLNSLGTPITQTHCYVLDKYLNPVPFGCIGELFISGGGVSRGYRSAQKVTAEAFLPDPWAQNEGGRMYKTGDKVFINTAGEIEFVGRGDRQVKIYGHRLEIDEIEYRLKQYPGIKDALVIYQKENIPPLYCYLVTDTEELYEILDNGEKIISNNMIFEEYLSHYLPSHAIPQHYEIIDTIPKNSSNKIDFNLLPKININQKIKKENINKPTSNIEKIIHNIYCYEFKREEIDIRKNFLTIGGYSLIAMKITAQIEKLLNISVDSAVVFKYPNIESLSQYLLKNYNENHIQQKAELLQNILDKKNKRKNKLENTI